MYGLRYGFTIVCYQSVSSMRKEAPNMTWRQAVDKRLFLPFSIQYCALDFTEMFVNAYTFIVTQRIRVGNCNRVNK